MSMPPTVRRRQVLGWAAAIGVTAGLGRFLTSWPLSGNRGDLDGVRLVRLLTATDSARIIGREYLRLAPDEAHPAVLTSLITARLADDPRALRAATAARLRQLLLDGTHRDFAEGLIVTLDGWMLSRTEARLCGSPPSSRCLEARKSLRVSQVPRAGLHARPPHPSTPRRVGAQPR